MKIPRLWIHLEDLLKNTNIGIKLIVVVLYQGHIDDYKFGRELALTCRTIKDVLDPIRSQLIWFMKMVDSHRLIDDLRQIPNVYHGLEIFKDIYVAYATQDRITYKRRIKGNKLDLSSCFMEKSERVKHYPFSINCYRFDLLSEQLKEFENSVEMNYPWMVRNGFATDFTISYNPKSWISVSYYPLYNYFMYCLV